VSDLYSSMALATAPLSARSCDSLRLEQKGLGLLPRSYRGQGARLCAQQRSLDTMVLGRIRGACSIACPAWRSRCRPCASTARRARDCQLHAAALLEKAFCPVRRLTPGLNQLPQLRLAGQPAQLNNVVRTLAVTRWSNEIDAATSIACSLPMEAGRTGRAMYPARYSAARGARRVRAQVFRAF